MDNAEKPNDEAKNPAPSHVGLTGKESKDQREKPRVSERDSSASESSSWLHKVTMRKPSKNWGNLTTSTTQDSYMSYTSPLQSDAASEASSPSVVPLQSDAASEASSPSVVYISTKIHGDNIENITLATETTLGTQDTTVVDEADESVSFSSKSSPVHIRNDESAGSIPSSMELHYSTSDASVESVASGYVENLNQLLTKTRDDLSSKLTENEALKSELTEVKVELDTLKKTTRPEEGCKYLQMQLTKANEDISNLTRQFKVEKRELEVQLAAEKNYTSDLLTAVNVADRMAREAEEREKLLLKEVEDLKKQLETAGIQAKEATSTKEATKPRNDRADRIRESLQQRCAMPNVRLIIQSLERQARPGASEPVPAVASVPMPPPPPPQREAPLLPLRDLQLRENHQQTPEEKKDPLQNLMYSGGSVRNALLSWCQTRLSKYPNVEITNFSTSWIDGLALCALMHTYLPDKIPFQHLSPNNKIINFQLAVKAAESVGIPNTLNIAEIVQEENPDWQKILSYVKEIYRHFELNA